MKVKDLIKELKKLKPEGEIQICDWETNFYWINPENVITEGDGFYCIRYE